MYPKGLIYKSGRSGSRGETYLHASKLKKIGYHLLRTFGAGLVTFAFAGILFSFWPIVREEFLYKFGSRQQAETSKLTGNIDSLRAVELGLDPHFSIYIPKIEAKAKVVANVDPGSPVEYLKALSQGVAHAKGTNFPGQGKNIYLFSHSTDSPLNIARYNAVFYLLGKLEKGDRVVIYFMDQEHEYVVTEKIVVSANDTSWLKDNGNGERLVLQTCDPPGTSWKRLLVIAKPI